MIRIPRWTLISAAVGPLLLIGGWTLAAAQQAKGYNPIRDTISSLAARGATDRWIMTLALAGLGACYIVTAIGLRVAGGVGRTVLVVGGLATLLVAAFPQPAAGNSVAHTGAATVAFGALAIWPVLATRRQTHVPLLTYPASIPATVIMVALVLWFVVEIHGGHRGLAERFAAGAEAFWPLAVVVASAFTLHRHHHPTRAAVPH
ncbi:MAG: DUF998 domain-containing protein [Acidimicrobiales bacterium]